MTVSFSDPGIESSAAGLRNVSLSTSVGKTSFAD
jgi:hypothetical protein